MTETTRRRLDVTDLLDRVRSMYTAVADTPSGPFHFEVGHDLAERLGYPAAVLEAVPSAATESFAGVGYFLDLAELQPGEQVLDLGSGSGTDTFAAAVAVGPSGRVTGVDLTPAQLAKAGRLADQAGFAQVAFVEGRIEEPPVAPGSVDCVISNGVINLAPDKGAVFRAAARASRPGGRLAIADIVTAVALPDGITCDASLWAACIGGAAERGEYLALIEAAGFAVQQVRENTAYRFLSDRARSATARYGVTSISVLATRAST